MSITLEGLLTSPAGWGMGTGTRFEATRLQRVLWRISDGLPIADLLACPEGVDPAEPDARGLTHNGFVEAVGKMIGCDASLLPNTIPVEFYVICGIRTAKSLTCAAAGLKAALTVNLDQVSPGDEACVYILSLTRTKAKKILKHLHGALGIGMPRSIDRPLKRLLARKPTSEAIWIRRPHDGKVVCIRIVAGAAAGGSLVADWVAAVVFDEATRMNGEQDGSIINFDDSRKAVLGRIMPGGQLLAVGSPWAPSGPMYDAVQERFGRPSPSLVVLRPPALYMNPSYWTPRQIKQLKDSPRGLVVYMTDFLGEFADPSSSFFNDAELRAVERKVADGASIHVPPSEAAGMLCAAAMDPATRRNAWTLVIMGRRWLADGSTKVVVLFNKQWEPQPGDPLKPEIVLKEIRDICKEYNLFEVFTDQWSSDSNAAIARLLGFTVTEEKRTTPEFYKMGNDLRGAVLASRVELSPDHEMHADLVSVKKLVTRRSIALDLPITPDGRHADYVPAVFLANDMIMKASSLGHAMEKLAEEGGRLLHGLQVRGTRCEICDMQLLTEEDLDRGRCWGCKDAAQMVG